MDCDAILFLKFLVVRLMKENSIGVANFDEIQDLLAYCKYGLVPFTLYIISLFMMDCRKYFSRTKNAVRNFEIGVEVLSAFQLELHSFANPYLQ